MNCTICGKPMRTKPPAKEPGERFNGAPSKHTLLFTAHTECLVRQNAQKHQADPAIIQKGQS